jgi:hypothetical protein
MASKITMRCTGCGNIRDITAVQAIKGRTFCPRCGNLEVAVK